jgi:hypothetical protein
MGVSGATSLSFKGVETVKMARPRHNSGYVLQSIKSNALSREARSPLEGSACIQKDRAMGQGSGVISLHGRFRAHGHTIRTALPACGIRLGLINRG